ncbi:hypothetical protein H5410_022238 [Solanum commersonii]|uniref:Uncharacterized protein n=1 Tax=Solanum commersonii TaxID=4109 RepID=A0A9J5ZEW2_SOLCO|nr:hypothetical protein H5410_022238 [Solanum commersonii]
MQRVLIKEIGFLGFLKQAKNEESTRPKSNFLELKPFESSSSSKPSPNLELKNRSKFSKICAVKDHSAKLVRIADQLGDLPFGLVHRRLALALSIIVFWIIRQHSTASRNCLYPCFPSNFKYLKLKATQTQPFKNEVSNSATQDSIMNAHNKTQVTYAKIKCALKDSSCDSPISKYLMLTILASNASSSSTKVFKCPHKRNDSNFTHYGLII